MPPAGLSAATQTSRRALVTGGSGGLGRAIARALARDGLDVIATYAHDDRRAKAVVEEVRAEPVAIGACAL
jgi:3-oxoacyl-[acyl-carrier protein] reductase